VSKPGRPKGALCFCDPRAQRVGHKNPACYGPPRRVSCAHSMEDADVGLQWVERTNCQTEPSKMDRCASLLVIGRRETNRFGRGAAHSIPDLTSSCHLEEGGESTRRTTGCRHGCEACRQPERSTPARVSAWSRPPKGAVKGGLERGGQPCRQVGARAAAVPAGRERGAGTAGGGRKPVAAATLGRPVSAASGPSCVEPASGRPGGRSGGRADALPRGPRGFKRCCRLCRQRAIAMPAQR
jgi:hypothetical protein